MTQNPTTNTEAGAVADVAAKLTEAQVAALLAAFRFIDNEAGILNGIPNEPSGDIADDPDEIALTLSSAFGIPFDECWPENLAQHLEQGTTAGVAEMNEQMFGQGDNPRQDEGTVV